MNIRINSAFLIALAALALFHREAQATHPLASDDTGTQRAGGIEVELSHQANRSSVADSDYQFNTAISVHFGLSKKIDLGLTTSFQSLLSPTNDWRSGLAPPVVDLKWRFWGEASSRSSLALRLDYSPKPLSTVSSGGHDLGALLVNCWNIGDVSLHLNLGGYVRDIAFEGTVGTLYTSAALTVPLTKTLQAAAETVYETGPFDGVHNVSGMGAVLWEISPGRVLSLGAGPIWEAGGRVGWIASVGLTIALPQQSSEDKS